MFAVLVVEDSRRVRDNYRRVLPEGVVMLDAPGRLSAIQQFRAHRASLGLIIVDGDLSGHNTLDTYDLVEAMRIEGYEGLMIAASSRADFGQRLMEAGCDREYDKYDLVDALPAIIARLRHDEH